MAHELIALYAKRDKSWGFTFFLITKFQRSLRTISLRRNRWQLRYAKAEIKADMERKTGTLRRRWSKTRVALRAAMKIRQT